MFFQSRCFTWAAVAMENIMINGQTVVGVIVARAGSKRLPNKNVMELGGIPLINWTVKAAHSSQTLDRTILSSDGQQIIEIAQKAGCEVPFHRPSQLANDEALASDVLEHALNNLEQDPDYAVLLQATSPLRTGEDIDECVRLCHEKNADTCMSITELDKPINWLLRLDDNQVVSPFYPQNDETSPVAFHPNGAVYVVRVSAFRKSKTFRNNDTVGYIMPRNRSIDIDSATDYFIAEALLKQKQK
jgi:CMP-N,N'-diacetyllegionaminic acid synthase